MLLVTAARAAPPDVEIEYAAPPAEQEALRASLLEALAGVDVNPRLQAESAIEVTEVVTRRPQAAPPLARIWIDLTREELAVYVADSAWERILIRLLPRSENPAVDHEQVAQIVAAAVQALRDGASIGISRHDARARLLPPAAPRPLEQATAPARPAPPAPPSSVWAGGGYEFLHRSAEVPVSHGASLQLGVTFAELSGLELGVELDAVFRPSRYASSDVSTRFDTLALRWLLTGSSARAHSLRLRAAVGGGLDAVHLQPEAVDGSLLASEPRTLVFGALRAAAGAELDLASLAEGETKLALATLLLADLELTDTRYVFSSAQGEEVAFDPFRVQPGLAVLLLIR